MGLGDTLAQGSWCTSASPTTRTSYDEDETLAPHEELERSYQERPNVRKLERLAPAERLRRHLRRRTACARPRRRRVVRPLEAARPARVEVHLVVPKNFNDAQQIADKFKVDVPGHPQPAGLRHRAVQAAHRLLQRAHLRARRRHAAGRRQGLPAHARATSRSPPRRRPGSSRRASSTSSELAGTMNVGLLGAGHIARALAEGWSRPGAGPGRPERLLVFDVVASRAAALAADTAEVAAGDVAAARGERSRDPRGAAASGRGGAASHRAYAGRPCARLRCRRRTAAAPPGCAARRASGGRVMPNVAAALGLGVFLFVPGTLGAAAEPVRELFATRRHRRRGGRGGVRRGHGDRERMPGFVARLAEAFTAAGVAGGLSPATAAAVTLGGLHGAAAARRGRG